MSFLPSWLNARQMKETNQSKLQTLIYHEIIGQNEKTPQTTQHTAKFAKAQLGISQQNTVQLAPYLSKNLVSPMILLSCAKLPCDDITSCGGLTLGECQVPTRPLYHSPSSTE